MSDTEYIAVGTSEWHGNNPCWVNGGLDRATVIKNALLFLDNQAEAVDPAEVRVYAFVAPDYKSELQYVLTNGLKNNESI